MGIWRSLTTGLKRVLGAPSLLFWTYFSNLAIALPLAYVMRAILVNAIGGSLVDQQLTTGFDLTWHGEFDASAQGMAKSFGPVVAGYLPVLDNLEKLLDGKFYLADASLLAAGAVYLLLWVFLSGGILERFANPEESRSRQRFFGQCGNHFWRLARLLILSLAAFGAIAYFVTRPLFRWLDDFTRDITVERSVILYTTVAYLLVGLLFVIVGMVVDYAKIAIVVERRSSVLLALLRSLGFILRHPLKTFGLYFTLLLANLLLFAVYAWVAPGSLQSNWTSLFFAFLVSQGFILGRILMKLWFLSSQTALFRALSGTSEKASSADEQPVPSSG